MSQEAKTAQDKILRDAVARSASDPGYFCRFFLRKWFPSDMPPFHLGLLALFTRKVSWLDEYPEAHAFLLAHFKYAADPADPDSPRLSVFQKTPDGKIFMVAGPNNVAMIPRGFSKTTLMNAANLYDALTDGDTFCIYISETADHANKQIGNIKMELESNEVLRAAYGNVVPTRADSEKWTDGEIQLLNGAILIGRGRGGQVRGVNFRARRPNKILLDDVEDEESVSTAEQRKKVSDWFYGTVMPAGNEMEGADEDEGQAPLQITLLGTLLNADALLVTVQRDETFNTVSFGALLPTGEALWPHKLGVEGYHKKRRRFQKVGKLAQFTREYDSTIRLEEDALFKYQNISMYVPTLLSDLVQRAIMLDPAISQKAGRDHTALIAAGRKANGMLWVLDEWGGLGKTPREQVDQLFLWQHRFQAHTVGIETVAYQAALVFLMKEEMARRGKFFIITPVLHGAQEKKTERINGILQPRYANAYVRHAKPLPILESQLADFPSGKVDYADALAMCFKLLGQTQMLAEGPLESNLLMDEVTMPHIDSILPPLYDSFYTLDTLPDPLRGRYG